MDSQTSQTTAGPFDIMRNGKLVSILNPNPSIQRHLDKFPEKCDELRVLADAAMAMDEAEAMARDAEEKHRRASDSDCHVVNRDYPLGHTPGPNPSPIPPQSAPGGHPIPRRGRYSLGFPSDHSGNWLRELPKEVRDKYFPMDKASYETPARSRDSSFVIITPEDPEDTITEIEVEPSPAPAAIPVPALEPAAEPAKRAPPHKVHCGISGCTQIFSSKSIADHRKTHILAEGGSEPAQQPCTGCAGTGKNCMVSTDPTNVNVNTYACLACLKGHRACSHKPYGRAVPRPRRHPALDPPQ